MNPNHQSIQWLSTDECEPYEKNPRRNAAAVDKIARSIEEFGFNQPIVLDKNNVVVVGHTRLRAAQQLKLDQVPVLYMDETIDPARVRAYRIADNKLNELSEWDTSYLVDELNALTDDLDDLEILGFNAQELEKLLTEANDEWLLPDEQHYTNVFEIAVECKDENEQERLYIKLKAEGYTCRVLTM